MATGESRGGKTNHNGVGSSDPCARRRSVAANERATSPDATHVDQLGHSHDRLRDCQVSLSAANCRPLTGSLAQPNTVYPTYPESLELCSRHISGVSVCRVQHSTVYCVSTFCLLLLILMCGKVIVESQRIDDSWAEIPPPCTLCMSWLIGTESSP